MELPDIQKTKDTRGVPIHRVGVTGIKVPIRLKTFNHEPAIPQHTVADFSMSVNLPEQEKGTHMSRFSQVLMEFLTREEALTEDFNIAKLHLALCERLHSEESEISATFSYFISQPSPETGVRGIAPVTVILTVTGTPFEAIESTTVVVNGKTVCPCSREISEYDEETQKGKGAHAQRSEIVLAVAHHPSCFIPFEDLIAVAQKSFSSPVYPVLKRPDERHVTMAAYANPKFVEDVIRDVVVNLHEWANGVEGYRSKLHAYEVRVQNAESIHYHDAYAEVRGTL